LDVSGSMSISDRIGAMKRAAKKVGLSLPGVKFVTWTKYRTGCQQLNRVLTAK
jgi:hypothetical protein